MGIWNDIKQKRKSKRDAIYLERLNGWPPNLVDKFLEWENAKVGSLNYWEPAPTGYIAWGIYKQSYEEFKKNPQTGPILVRR